MKRNNKGQFRKTTILERITQSQDWSGYAVIALAAMLHIAGFYALASI